MNNKKKFFSILMGYLFTMSVIPCGFLTQTAEAATAPKDYTNNYRVLGDFKHDISSYKNYGVILGDHGLYLTKSNTYERYICPVGTNYQLMGVTGDNAYMLTNYAYSNYNSLKIANLSNKKVTNKTFPKLNFSYKVTNATTDNKGGLWFSIDGKSSATASNYYIMRIDANTNAYSLYKYDRSTLGYLTGFYSDNSGNVWFRSAKDYNFVGKVSYTNGKIVANNYTTDVNFSAYSKYAADSKNNLYFYNDSKIVELSLSGNKFVQSNSYAAPTASAKVNEISVDKADNLWFLNGTENYTLFKVENSAFSPRYNVTVGYVPQLNVTDDNDFTTSSAARIKSYSPTDLTAIYTNASSDTSTQGVAKTHK